MRLSKWIATSSVIALLAGCAFKQPPNPAPVSHAPLVLDEATLHRNWPVSVAHYANGATTAGPTAAILTYPPHSPVWIPILLDPAYFVGNSLAAPVVYMITPPWQDVVYSRGFIEASHNAMPPLPPR